jgi:hypothetical protein
MATTTTEHRDKRFKPLPKVQPGESDSDTENLASPPPACDRDIEVQDLSWLEPEPISMVNLASDDDVQRDMMVTFPSDAGDDVPQDMFQYRTILEMCATGGASPTGKPAEKLEDARVFYYEKIFGFIMDGRNMPLWEQREKDLLRCVEHSACDAEPCCEGCWWCLNAGD